MEVDQEILKNKYKMAELVQEAYRKGDMQFVEKYIDYCRYTDQANEIIMEQYKNGNLDFVMQHIEMLRATERGFIVKSEYSNGNMDFVDKCIDGYSGIGIIEQEYDKGNIDFVKKHFAICRSRREIAYAEYEKYNSEIADLFWQELDLDTKHSMAYEAYKTGDIEKLRKFMGYEKQNPRYAGEILCGALGDKDFALELIKAGSGLEYTEKVSTEYSRHDNYGTVTKTPILCKALNLGDDQSKLEIIQELLQAGADSNSVISYEDDWLEIKESTPALYVALKLEDEDLRKQVLTEMLQSGVDPTLKHTFEERGKTYEYSCLDVNDGELRRIMQEIGMEIPEVEYTQGTNIVDFELKTSDYGTYDLNVSEETRMQTQTCKDNRELVTDFLTHEVGLSAEEISELEKTYSELSRDIYGLSIESLRMQKMILDSCGGTKQGFTTEARQILTKSPELLYSRLMFCREEGISVSPDRLSATIGISKRGFAKNFGEKILDRGQLNEMMYGRRVQHGLITKYPMPETQEELKKDLETREKAEV